MDLFRKRGIMKKMTRREFIAKGSMVVGGTLGGLALGGGIFSPPQALSAEVKFSESSCKTKKENKRKILVAYASFCGSTGGVAEAIGRDLCEQGAQVDVRFIKNVSDISSYEGAVLGSSVRSSFWLPEAMEFIKKNQERLSRIPVAYFLTCLTLYQDNAEKRGVARSYMNPVLKSAPSVQPFDLGLFAGVLDYSKLNIVYRTIMKSKMKKQGIPEGDFRNWEAIRAWARNLGSPLGLPA
jgi:menaquinone-dependent protoporphyrinogen oxidase